MKRRILGLLAASAIFAGTTAVTLAGEAEARTLEQIESETRTPRYGIDIEVRSDATDQSFEISIEIRNRSTGEVVARPVLNLVLAERDSVQGVDQESNVEYLVHAEVGDHGGMLSYRVEMRDPSGEVSVFDSLVPLDG